MFSVLEFLILSSFSQAPSEVPSLPGGSTDFVAEVTGVPKVIQCLGQFERTSSRPALTQQVPFKLGNLSRGQGWLTCSAFLGWESSSLVSCDWRVVPW